MVYFTLFHFDPTNLISFDQYLAIASNAHWWIVKWWLWLYTYSSTSKWSDRASFFTIPSNEWWRFLFNLREVLNTERMLSCRSLIKKDINFWKEDLQPESNEDESYEMIDKLLRDRTEEISETVLDDDSSEVATTISGYIAKMLLKRSKCKDCENKLTVHD